MTAAPCSPRAPRAQPPARPAAAAGWDRICRQERASGAFDPRRRTVAGARWIGVPAVAVRRPGGRQVGADGRAGHEHQQAACLIFKSKANKGSTGRRIRARRSTTRISGSWRCCRRCAAAWPTWPPAASGWSCSSASSSSSRPTSCRSRRRRRSRSGREDLAREALTRRAALQSQIADLRDAARRAAGRGGEAHRSPRSGCRPRSRRSDHEGDDQGHLHRGRGADPDQRGGLRHLRGDGRRRPGHAAGRGQDRADAGAGRRDRRAARLGRARRRDQPGGRDDIQAELDRAAAAPTSRRSWRR